MSHPSSLLLTAIAHHQAGRLPQAEKAYRQLLKGDPSHSEVLRLLGGVYVQLGRMRHAVEYLEKAIALRPGDFETITNLGVALRGLGRNDAAIACYSQALLIKPDYLMACTNLGGLYQEMGRVPEAISAFEQGVRMHPGDAGAHVNYANGLFAAGRVSEAITHYHQALDIKDDHLEAMINLGMAYSQAGKSEAAEKVLTSAQAALEKLLQINPRNVTALNNLGNILQRLGKPDLAINSYQKALQIRPDYAQAMANMATALRLAGRWQDAIDLCQHAIRIMPESADMYINLGVFLQEMSRHEEAIEAFDHALEKKPTSVYAQWNKTLSLLALGRYAEGWALHEVGLGIASMRGDYVATEKRWHGEPLMGKRLLICGEQGFGDNLQFVRYTALCKAQGARVVVQCPPVLHRLLANCPFIDEIHADINSAEYDFHVPMMSLPYLFDTRLETIPTPIPYLQVSKATQATWSKFFSPCSDLKVGLVWAGNAREKLINAHMVDQRRSIDLNELRPLFDVSGVRFYNLQMGVKAAQIDAYDLRQHFIDFMSEVRDFEDTAAIIEQLDLVISVDTSVVHLAGGMGKPVWVLSRFDACWRWLQNQPHSPWYPSAYIFGQPSFGDWTSVVNNVRKALVEKVNSMT